MQYIHATVLIRRERETGNQGRQGTERFQDLGALGLPETVNRRGECHWTGQTVWAIDSRVEYQG